MNISAADITRFYGASTFALRGIDRASGLRFGADADARWRLFRGELEDADRLDLLLRDAAVAHPGGFAARIVFDLEGLADDEPFGPDWPGIDASSATAMLRDASARQRVELTDLASIWGLSAQRLPKTRLDGITPATRIVAAGSIAVLALAEHFAAQPGFDLGDQVTFIGDGPASRHLFGLAVALLGGTSQARILNSRISKASGRVDRVLVSDDASVDEKRAAEALG
jgi:hypothetical protein